MALKIRLFSWTLALAVSAILPPAVGGQSASLPQNQGFITVAKILGNECASCHEWASSYKGIADPSRIVASFPEKSLLYLQVSSDRMPPGAVKLSAEDKALIKAWIAAGAPFPVPEPCPCGLE